MEKEVDTYVRKQANGTPMSEERRMRLVTEFWATIGPASKQAHCFNKFIVKASIGKFTRGYYCIGCSYLFFHICPMFTDHVMDKFPSSLQGKQYELNLRKRVLRNPRDWRKSKYFRENIVSLFVRRKKSFPASELKSRVTTIFKSLNGSNGNVSRARAEAEFKKSQLGQPTLNKVSTSIELTH
jgi:hypothetical protein